MSGVRRVRKAGLGLPFLVDGASELEMRRRLWAGRNLNVGLPTCHILAVWFVGEGFGLVYDRMCGLEDFREAYADLSRWQARVWGGVREHEL